MHLICKNTKMKLELKTMRLGTLFRSILEHQAFEGIIENGIQNRCTMEFWIKWTDSEITVDYC